MTRKRGWSPFLSSAPPPPSLSFIYLSFAKIRGIKPASSRWTFQLTVDAYREIAVARLHIYTGDYCTNVIRANCVSQANEYFTGERYNGALAPRAWYQMNLVLGTAFGPTNSATTPSSCNTMWACISSMSTSVYSAYLFSIKIDIFNSIEKLQLSRRMRLSLSSGAYSA